VILYDINVHVSFYTGDSLGCCSQWSPGLFL